MENDSEEVLRRMTEVAMQKLLAYGKRACTSPCLSAATSTVGGKDPILRAPAKVGKGDHSYSPLGKCLFTFVYVKPKRILNILLLLRF